MTDTVTIDADNLKNIEAFRNAVAEVAGHGLATLLYLALSFVTLLLTGVLIPVYFDASCLGFLAGYLVMLGRSFSAQRRFHKARQALCDELGELAKDILKESK